MSVLFYVLFHLLVVWATLGGFETYFKVCGNCLFLLIQFVMSLFRVLRPHGALLLNASTPPPPPNLSAL